MDNYSDYVGGGSVISESQNQTTLYCIAYVLHISAVHYKRLKNILGCC